MPNDPVEFDGFAIDVAAFELRKDGRRVELSPQGVRLLLALIQRRGELVSRHELYQVLWPGETDVDVDRGLNTLIRQVRHTLGDSATTPRFIQTYPRRGYRFLPPPPTNSSREVAGTAWRRRLRPEFAWALFVIAGIAVAFLGPRRSDHDAGIPGRARELFALGQQLLESPTPAQRPQAVPLFTDAVRLAPGSARARAYLADALLWAGRAEEAEQEAQRALALDRRESHALFIGGLLALIREWDWHRAETLLRQSTTRDPDRAVYQITLAFVLSTAGKTAQALTLLEAAHRKDPASAILTADIGMIYLYAGRAELAARACEQAARVAPEALYPWDCALAARSRMGDFAAARAHAASMVRLVGERVEDVMGDSNEPAPAALGRYYRWEADRAASAGVRTFGAALSFAQAGRHADAIEALSRSAAAREMGFVTATVDPRLSVLRHDPRFRRLLERLVAQGAMPPGREHPSG